MGASSYVRDRGSVISRGVEVDAYVTGTRDNQGVYHLAAMTAIINKDGTDWKLSETQQLPGLATVSKGARLWTLRPGAEVHRLTGERSEDYQTLTAALHGATQLAASARHAQRRNDQELARKSAETGHLTADDIVDAMPEGYRWATALETENWTSHRDQMVQVRVESLAPESQTDLAIKRTVLAEPTPDQSYCDVDQHQQCSGYTEDEGDPETCMCNCHDEQLRAEEAAEAAKPESPEDWGQIIRIEVHHTGRKYRMRHLATDEVLVVEGFRHAEWADLITRTFSPETEADERVQLLAKVPVAERCPTCGQPDNTGDCNHAPLSIGELRTLLG